MGALVDWEPCKPGCVHACVQVQTAFREHGARLQSIYDRRQRTDVEMARREQEMKQLQGALPALAPVLPLGSPILRLSETVGCSVARSTVLAVLVCWVDLLLRW